MKEKNEAVEKESKLERLTRELEERKAERCRVDEQLGKLRSEVFKIDAELAEAEGLAQKERMREEASGYRERHAEETEAAQQRAAVAEGELERLRGVCKEVNVVARKISAKLEKTCGEILGSMSILREVDPKMAPEGKVEIAKVTKFAQELGDTVWAVVGESPDGIKEIVGTLGPRKEEEKSGEEQ